MWTPRRIFLSVVGLFLCAGAYAVYAHFLGWVDGLPPIPEAYLVPGPPAEELPPGDEKPVLRRVQEAFGRNCEEMHYWIQLDSRARGLLLAAGEFNVEEDGRVQLTPCSVAIFGKTRGPGGVPEISTVHCDRAFLEFDRPVKKLSEMDGRKIIAAELRSDSELFSNDPRKGKIHIRNNRRSADPDDALVMRTVGPIFYKESPPAGTPEVLTDAVVEMTDYQNLPKNVGPDRRALPPTVTATGLKIFLATEAAPKTSNAKSVAAAKAERNAPSPNAPEKKGGGAVTGVEHIELNAMVTMNLWSEPGNTFPGAGPKAQPGTRADGPPAEKTLVQIHTEGPFRYDVEADRARFDHAPMSDPSIPNYVQVTRYTKDGRDMLTCDHLQVEFARKTTPAPPPAKTPAAPAAAAGPPPAPKDETDMDVKRIHAWGKTLVISSDGDDLTAWGNDLVHTNTPQRETVLVGEPLIAVKDGNQIRGRELTLLGAGDRTSQQARVKGPGQIDLGQMDPVTKKHSFTRQAVWQDWLVFSRVKEQRRDLDLLILTGGARFADTPNDQFLQARQLKVWLVPKEDKKPNPKAAAAPAPTPSAGGSGLQQARPQRLEGTGQVVAHSPELDLPNAEYLNVWFREAPARPAALDGKAAGPPAPPPAGAGPPPAGVAAAKSGPKEKTPPVADKRNPPIRVKARRVEAWVLVTDGKNDLERAHMEEQVAVHQDPTPENERGVDIAGHTVDLEHYADGNTLLVGGQPDKVAGEVHFDKLSLIADDITVDQRNNAAVVKGAGSMRMLAGSTLQGDKLATPTYITVHWKDAMEFRGSERWARFEGAVQAEQADARVLCETMQVMLDNPVWLNPAQKPRKGPKDGKDDAPKVEFVVCDQQPRDGAGDGRQPQPVTFTDEAKEMGKLARWQQIEARELNLDNVKADVVAPGPGVVRVYQLGSKDPLAGPPPAPAGPAAKAAPKQPEQVMKLTVVKYRGRMKGNNKTRIAVFYDTIDVVHLPASGPDQKYDVNKLPVGSMRLRCDNSLEVFTKRVMINGAAHNAQNLTARGNVKVESDEFSGTAEAVKYEEEKETVIFEGSRENPAILYQVEGQGLPPRRTAAVKITYNKRTKACEADQQIGVQSN